VLSLLVQGKANKVIARTMGIEETTVKVYLRLIMGKLGVANRTQAAIAARRLGIAAAGKVTAPRSPGLSQSFSGHDL